jgi:hypothetical protein
MEDQSLTNKIPIRWNRNFKTLNVDGVKPPKDSLIVGQFDKNSTAFPLFQIDARSPYRVQYMVNQYGGLNTKFGTMMGASK